MTKRSSLATRYFASSTAPLDPLAPGAAPPPGGGGPPATRPRGPRRCAGPCASSPSRSGAARHRREDDDRVVEGDRRLQFRQVADVLVVEVDVDEAVEGGVL